MATVVAAVTLAALVFGGDGSDTARADDLAARLRCPVCQSESVADSASQTARDMRALIDEQLAAGASDQEVIDFFVGRYGEWIVLDAPARGRTLVLWLLPLGAAVVGLVVIAARRRPATPRAVDSASLEEDERDLERQVELGEVDPETAANLRATYEAERAADVAPAPSRLPRLIAGGTVLVVGLAVVIFAVVRAADPREPGEFATGGIAQDGGRDLASVTNEELEQVVAANPDVIPMRLALARRYFNDGDFSAALPHYLAVLEDEAHPEALANVGWMAYLSNEPRTAAGYLEHSLEVAPGYLPAQWFLANVRLFGLDDPAGAEPLIRAVLAADDVPPDVRAEAEAMLERVTG